MYFCLLVPGTYLYIGTNNDNDIQLYKEMKKLPCILKFFKNK